jgi:hypothetical protein
MGHTPDAYAELLGALLLDPWGDQASCIGKADVLEAPNETPAKTMCAYCPVIQECTTWVLGLSHKQDPGGVRAGMNENQRNRTRRKARILALEATQKAVA